MTTHPMLDRRAFGAALAASLAMPWLPRPAAAAGSVVAAVFPNTWEDAYRKLLTPVLKGQGTELVVAPALAQDQLAKLLASPGRPAYDAVLMSPGQTAVAIEKGVIDKIDPGKLTNWGLLDDSFKSDWGPTVTVEVNGIAYNPELVPRPKGYRDLFENPAYHGKVAWIGFGSNTATMAWVELAKLYGGSADNLEPMFRLLKDHLPKIGAIANNGSHQMTLFQQREIGVFMASTGNVARLKSLGVPCEFVHPESGSPAIPVTIHMTKGAGNPAAVLAYMDAAISKPVQDQLTAAPTEMFPTNREVALSPAIAAYVTRDQLKGFVYPDWAKINRHRDEWTRAFDRIVKS